MPRKKWIDKNAPNTQTFQLLYRSQDDPFLHENSGGERALFAVNDRSQASAESSSSFQQEQSGLHLVDLEDDVDLEHMRENEGEAAEYGVFFDDTQYDYMQHLRDLGEGAGDGYFVDAAPVKVKGKGKTQTMKLEDALRMVSLDEKSVSGETSILEDDYSTFSRSTKQRTYQNQQDVPDEIAGFQPDMDPRLREVLEALDDDAYVDDIDQDDIFGQLGKAGKDEGEIDLEEFEFEVGDEEEGWESDVTEKAVAQPKELTLSNLGDKSIDSHIDVTDASVAAAAAADDGEWLKDFAKFKRDVTTSKRAAPNTAGSIVSGLQDRAPTLYTLNGTPLRQKKRKGALTNPSAYSMTSSSLARTDGQQLLDQRFDQIEKMYALDEGEEFDDADGGMSMLSGLTGKSKMSQLSSASFADEGAVRGDFDGMMDSFFGDWNKANPGGKRKGAKGKRGKNGNEVVGLQQLDELRAELGPARINRKGQRA